MSVNMVTFVAAVTMLPLRTKVSVQVFLSQQVNKTHLRRKTVARHCVKRLTVPGLAMKRKPIPLRRSNLTS